MTSRKKFPDKTRHSSTSDSFSSSSSTAAKGSPSTFIYAAALQDHLARSISLRLPPRQSKFKTPQNQLQHQKTSSKSGLISPPISGRKFNDIALEGYRKVWVCENCTLENDELIAETRCAACGAIRPRKNRVGSSLTLAQTLGLVQAPAPKLSRDEWETCEQRAEERGDTVNPCSICREPFGIQDQVILSCSHMFHQACLTSFERFLRAKQRVCPLCRKADYQKKMTTKAAQAHRRLCIIKIQAFLRGCQSRKATQPLWNAFYKAGKGDPKRRRDFLAKRVSQTTERLLSAMRVKEDSVDQLLAEFDRSISYSRQVFQDQPEESELENTNSDQKKVKGDDWASIYLKAKERNDCECPICINPFKNPKYQSLLTCTHVFHTDCLQAFEEFNIYEVHLCPVCRSHYRSKPWQEIIDHYIR